MGRPLPKQGEQLAKAYRNNPVPLRLHTQQMMVKLTAPGTEKGSTAELDIVVVLDTSGSMGGQKLLDMKAAMKFLIGKLGASDRLAIVPFSCSVGNRYPNYSMRAMTDSNEKKKAIDAVERLHAHGNTNIHDGLETGINILMKERREKALRASCIFLMSDGDENVNKASSLLDRVADITVHTFGFGENSNEKLLYEIAYESHVGIYHHVREKEATNDLMESFSSLAIFRSISMLGLRVTLSPSRGGGHQAISILRVDPCRYKVEGPNTDGSFTIHFGDLAREENRRILVDVQLPSLQQEEKDMPVIKVEYSYSPPAKVRGPGPSLQVSMDRVQNPNRSAVNRDVNRELVRRGQAEYLRRVMDLANGGDMETARVEVDRARNDLNTLGSDEDDAVDILFDELDNLREFLASYETYDKLGRAYLLACICSHERQRYAARGGSTHIAFYLTNRMTKYLKQARELHKNPETCI